LISLSGSLSGSLWNVYGPTETTIWSSIAQLSADHPEPLLGAPLRNTTLYILDAYLQPVPAGVAGELYIGGDGLARGYLGRPALTAERFVPSPFAEPSSGGARLYRTGDRVRRRADGGLEYLGRVDFQVKLRGHRIELGEIEARLLEQPAVAAAAVILREDAPGDQRLVAYVVAKDPASTDAAAEAATDAAAVQAALRHSLPDYMVPPFVVFLDALPRSPAGKLDRKALPIPDRGGTTSSRDLVAPRDELERRLAAIWQDVLGVPAVGVHDGFFDLGGHSLTATRLASRLREDLAVELPLRVLFEATTVAELADALRAGTYGAISEAEVDEMSSMLDLLENQ
jgi:acyl carrier protein